MIVLLWNMLLDASLGLWVRLSVIFLLSNPVPRAAVRVVCDCLLLDICSSLYCAVSCVSLLCYE